MANFSDIISDFITTYQYYPSWGHLESSLRSMCNDQLKIKSLELVKINHENQSLYQDILKSKIDFSFNEAQPFPLTLIHKNQYAHPIALTRIGQKKSKNTFSAEEQAALKKLHQYLNQQVQYLKDRDNITENLNLQTTKFQTAQIELQRLGASKDNFLSIASHELRTPMSVIRGYADFLLSEQFGALNDQQKNFLQKILTNTNHLTQLINNMLDVSKLEAGKMKFNLQKTNLKQCLEDVIIDHQILLNEKQQILKFKCDPNIKPMLNTDPEKVSLVLANLISNAFKFSPNKSTITISLKPQLESDFWLVRVADTGVGVPDKHKSELFEKFQQVDNSLQKKHTGTGLGLSICREIIQNLGGHIWVEDNTKASSGAIFNFTLPA